MEQKKLFTTNQLVKLSLLTAVTIILQRYFVIETDILKLSFKFVPVSLCAMMFGPLATGIMAAVADVIGVVFLSGKTMHLGFTISEFVTGLIYGYFFYKKPVRYKNIAMANAVLLVVITAGLNSIWLSQLWGAKFTYVTWYVRIIKELIILPIKIKLTYEINILIFNRLKNKFALNRAN